MSETPKNGNPIVVNDPISYAWEQIAKQAAAWCADHKQTEAILLYHEPVNALDLKTRERYLEVRGDLIKAGPTPLASAKVLKKLYATIKVTESQVIG